MMHAPCTHKRTKELRAILKGGAIELIEITCSEGHVWVEKAINGIRKVVKIKHG